jgi:hypothetical protein
MLTFPEGGLMKLTLTKLLCTSLMLTFLVGCGKDNASGGGGNPPVINQYQGNIPADSQQAFQNVSAWYGSTQEGLPSNAGPRTEYRTIQNYNDSNNCKTKTYLGFIDINYCLSSSNEGTSSTAQRTVNVVLGQSKSFNNPKLVSVFSPASGLVLKTVTEQQSPIGQNYKLFTIDYVKSNGHILRYKIDTGLNSAFNPVEIYDTELRRSEYVTNLNSLLY